jgi:hypothetical protein
MLVWGSGRKQVRLRAAGTKSCTNCGTDRSFSVKLHYAYAHVYYLFSWITRRDYLLVCDVCSHSQTLTRPDAEAGLSEDPIPFLERSGGKSAWVSLRAWPPCWPSCPRSRPTPGIRT